MKIVEDIDPKRIPKHVAIIMDGNRRWARREGLSVAEGHKRGAENVRTILKAALSLGISYLTVYAFSTENWRRPSMEIKILMRLFQTYLLREKKSFLENDVRFHCIGDRTKLSASLQKVLHTMETETATCGRMHFVLALNYGARNEIVRAVQKAFADYTEHGLDIDALTEEKFTHYLDTAQMPDPDLFIRTSGESRISNFLLWQLAYAEFYLTDILWPGFDEAAFVQAIKEYQQRQRRHGGGK